jgi:SnoaL-like domain
MRYIDDQAGGPLGELFDEDAVLQLAGTVFSGREAIGKMFRSPDPPHWTEPGELLKQPGVVHRGANPIIDLDGDTATAETDLLVLERDEAGRARITLVARYRDRFRRGEDGRWVITNRTGVSIARPGDAGTDAEWSRALARMPDETRARFRTE